MKNNKLFVGLILCAMVSAAGTDLVLPAIPQITMIFDAVPEVSQRVLSAYVAGNACGLLFFGYLSDYLSRKKLLLSSLLLFSLSSVGCAYSPGISLLIVSRFVQGIASSTVPVIIPGLIRELFCERSAVRAIGLLGSIQALVPAVAPLIGILLLIFFDWSISFKLLAFLTIAAAAMVLISEFPELLYIRKFYDSIEKSDIPALCAESGTDCGGAGNVCVRSTIGYYTYYAW